MGQAVAVTGGFFGMSPSFKVRSASECLPQGRPIPNCPRLTHRGALHQITCEKAERFARRQPPTSATHTCSGGQPSTVCVLQGHDLLLASQAQDGVGESGGCGKKREVMSAEGREDCAAGLEGLGSCPSRCQRIGPSSKSGCPNTIRTICDTSGPP